MGLFTPAWKRTDKQDKAMEFLRNTTDQKLLQEIAKNAPLADVRQLAAYKLTDEATLKEIAATDSSSEVRGSALCRITDESYLIAYSLQINDRSLAALAGERVKSQLGLAALAAVSGWDGVVRDCLKRLGNKPSPEAVKLLEQSGNATVRNFAKPFKQDPGERNRMALTEPDAKVRCKIIESLTDYKTLYRCATEDKERNCRIAARGRLTAVRQSAPAKWWNEHIDEAVRDQRVPLLLQKAAAGDTAASDELAKRYVADDSDLMDSYLLPRCPMAVVDALERLLRAGEKKAGKTLYALYKSDELNPELADHARAQAARFTQSHRDGMVDSAVCGETFRHEDSFYDHTVAPL